MAGLEGVKVVELTQYAAGPAAGRALAEMGATVIKVEPFTGDEQRTQGMAWGMAFRTEFDDVAYDCGSFNKEWTAINAKNPEGLEVMYKLLETADIFLTSLRSGALQRLGLDYETLHEKFPRLVWAQNRGYGEHGPMKDAKGFDATAFAARSGFVSAIPQANAHYEPGNSPIAFGDWNTGCALAAGILGAYAGALRTGQGDQGNWFFVPRRYLGYDFCSYRSAAGLRLSKGPHGSKMPNQQLLCFFRWHLVPYVLRSLQQVS